MIEVRSPGGAARVELTDLQRSTLVNLSLVRIDILDTRPRHGADVNSD